MHAGTSRPGWAVHSSHKQMRPIYIPARPAWDPTPELKQLISWPRASEGAMQRAAHFAAAPGAPQHPASSKRRKCTGRPRPGRTGPGRRLIALATPLPRLTCFCLHLSRFPRAPIAARLLTSYGDHSVSPQPPNPTGLYSFSFF